MKRNTKTFWLFMLIILLLGLAVISGLCLGSFFISPKELLNPDKMTANILMLRMLRVLCAFTVGGSLAVSGLAYQAALKNPLAEPYILGISGGASLGAAAAIVTGLANLTVFAVPGFAFVFALGALSFVLLAGRGKYSDYSTNILLSGVIVGAVCSSMLMFVISNLGYHELNSVTWWMLGNLQAANQQLLKISMATALLGTALLFAIRRDANLIALSEETAHNMGVPPIRATLLLLGVASLMAAASVALAGIISFVGLIVPHILRKLFGADHRKLFPLGLLAGGAFLIICDTISRSIMPAQEIPAGVVTALIGGPFFIWLLNSRKGGDANA